MPVLAQNPAPDDGASRLIRSRAVEAVIWGMPAVNTDLMRQEMLTKTSGKVNQIIYWGRPLDWHNQTLTPNPDAIYFMAFFNTKDVGPIVLEFRRAMLKLVERQHRYNVADRARRRRPARPRQGRRRRSS